MSEEQSDLWGFEKVEEQMSEKQLSQDQMSWVALCTRSNLSEANVWVANVEEHLSGTQMSHNHFAVPKKSFCDCSAKYEVFLYKGLVFFPGAFLSFSGSRD